MHSTVLSTIENTRVLDRTQGHKDFSINQTKDLIKTNTNVLIYSFNKHCSLSFMHQASQWQKYDEIHKKKYILQNLFRSIRRSFIEEVGRDRSYNRLKM